MRFKLEEILFEVKGVLFSELNFEYFKKADCMSFFDWLFSREWTANKWGQREWSFRYLGCTVYNEVEEVEPDHYPIRTRLYALGYTDGSDPPNIQIIRGFFRLFRKKYRRQF